METRSCSILKAMRVVGYGLIALAFVFYVSTVRAI